MLAANFTPTAFLDVLDYVGGPPLRPKMVKMTHSIGRSCSRHAIRASLPSTYKPGADGARRCKLVEHTKERARGPGMSLRPSSFARWVINWPDLSIVALALAIVFLRVVFWHGWELLRFVGSFGIAAAVMLGSLLCTPRDVRSPPCSPEGVEEVRSDARVAFW